MIDLTREEAIYILMRRRGWRCPDLARALKRRRTVTRTGYMSWLSISTPIHVKPDTLYRILNRKTKPGGRGRAAHVKRILAACEAILEEE